MYLIEYFNGPDLVKKVINDFEAMYYFVKDLKRKSIMYDIFKLDYCNNFVKFDL